ncbi:hypothetical protein H8E07_15030, partial [bacterium]|nr:hypothetical protein [bacterium]
MKPMIRITTIALVLLAAAGLTLGDARDEIIFPHDLHFEEDIDCATCHELAPQAPMDDCA